MATPKDFTLNDLPPVENWREIYQPNSETNMNHGADHSASLSNILYRTKQGMIVVAGLREKGFSLMNHMHLMVPEEGTVVIAMHGGGNPLLFQTPVVKRNGQEKGEKFLDICPPKSESDKSQAAENWRLLARILKEANPQTIVVMSCNENGANIPKQIDEMIDLPEDQKRLRRVYAVPPGYAGRNVNEMRSWEPVHMDYADPDSSGNAAMTCWRRKQDGRWKSLGSSMMARATGGVYEEKREIIQNGGERSYYEALHSFVANKGNSIEDIINVLGIRPRAWEVVKKRLFNEEQRAQLASSIQEARNTSMPQEKYGKYFHKRNKEIACCFDLYQEIHTDGERGLRSTMLGAFREKAKQSKDWDIKQIEKKPPSMMHQTPRYSPAIVNVITSTQMKDLAKGNIVVALTNVFATGQLHHIQQAIKTTFHALREQKPPSDLPDGFPQSEIMDVLAARYILSKLPNEVHSDAKRFLRYSLPREKSDLILGKGPEGHPSEWLKQGNISPLFASNLLPEEIKCMQELEQELDYGHSSGNYASRSQQKGLKPQCSPLYQRFCGEYLDEARTLTWSKKATEDTLAQDILRASKDPFLFEKYIERQGAHRNPNIPTILRNFICQEKSLFQDTTFEGIQAVIADVPTNYRNQVQEIFRDHMLKFGRMPDKCPTVIKTFGAPPPEAAHSPAVERAAAKNKGEKVRIFPAQ